MRWWGPLRQGSNRRWETADGTGDSPERFTTFLTLSSLPLHPSLYSRSPSFSFLFPSSYTLILHSIFLSSLQIFTLLHSLSLLFVISLHSLLRQTFLAPKLAYLTRLWEFGHFQGCVNDPSGGLILPRYHRSL